MEDKTIAKGLSVAAIILIVLSAITLTLSSANGLLYGRSAIPYGAIFVAAFAIPLLMILILLSRYVTSTDTMEDMIATIAVRYAIFGWFFIFVIKFSEVFFLLFFEDFYVENHSSLALIMNSINVCVIGTLVLTFLLKNVRAYKIEKRPMKAGQLLLLIMMMYGLTQVGSMMGLPIHLALSSFTVEDDQALGDLSGLMLGSGVIVRIITVGILPAIFEELLFRKFLIDRTIRYGEFISCAMSGIMFGLWHGNFQQFFFAFFVGVLFSFVYIRTGNIIYTMIMHASMNLVTTTVTMQLLAEFMKKAGYDFDTGTIAEVTDSHQYLAQLLPIMLLIIVWLMILASFQIVGFVMLIVKRKKFKLTAMEGEPGRKVILHKLTHSVYMWVFFAFALLLFVYSYLPDIVAFLYLRLS